MAFFLSSSFLNPSLSSSPNNPSKNSATQYSSCRPFLFSFSLDYYNISNSDHLLPSLSFSIFFFRSAYNFQVFFRSAYNFQVIPAENELEEKLIGRFRREVLRSGVLQESKRRRFFESTQEKKKRKSRDAARRNRKRRPQPKALLGDTKETLKDEGYKSDENQWDFIDLELPYTRPYRVM